MPLSRREAAKDIFLISAGLAGGIFLAPRLSPVPVIDSLITPEPIAFLLKENALTKEGAAAFAKNVRKTLQMIFPYAPKPPETVYEARELINELAPNFIAERIFTGHWSPDLIHFNEDAQVITPHVIATQTFEGKSYFHITGQSDCDEHDGKLFVSGRFFNKFSPWYGKTEVVTTLAHELAHLSGQICDFDPDIEVAAQMAALEVLAAESTRGNKNTVLATLALSLQFAESYFVLESLKEDNGEFYRNYLRQFSDWPSQTALFDKNLDDYKADPGNLTNTLEIYGAEPYRVLIGAMTRPSNLTRELPVHNKENRINMNDTKYILSHLNELARTFSQSAK